MPKSSHDGGSARRAGRAGAPAALETNLTSMLDLIFNVMAFFVITYQSPIEERQYDVALLPARRPPVTGGLPQTGESEPIDFPVEIILRSGPDAGLAVTLQRRPLAGGLGQLRAELRRLHDVMASLHAPEDHPPLSSATIRAAADVKYRDVIAVVDACHRARLAKIDFLPLTAQGPP